MALATLIRSVRAHLALTLTVASLIVWSSWHLILGPTHP